MLCSRSQSTRWLDETAEVAHGLPHQIVLQKHCLDGSRRPSSKVGCDHSGMRLRGKSPETDDGASRRERLLVGPCETIEVILAQSHPRAGHSSCSSCERPTSASALNSSSP
jgi:hypothetical protein